MHFPQLITESSKSKNNKLFSFQIFICCLAHMSSPTWAQMSQDIFNILAIRGTPAQWFKPTTIRLLRATSFNNYTNLSLPKYTINQRCHSHQVLNSSKLLL